LLNSSWRKAVDDVRIFYVQSLASQEYIIPSFPSLWCWLWL